MGAGAPSIAPAKLFSEMGLQLQEMHDQEVNCPEFERSTMQLA